MPYRNLPEMFFERARALASAPRYRCRLGDGWREVTWAEMEARVMTMAAGLLELGVAPGDRVGLLCATRPEWMELDLAIMACGGVTVPIYPSNLAAECGYILSNAECSLAFVENPGQLAKVEEVRADGFDLDGVRHPVTLRTVISIEGPAAPEATLHTLMGHGERALPTARDEIARRVSAMDRDALATIVYTSGTTGPPKGVRQTHGNHLATLEATLSIGLAREGDVDFFFLPLAHSFARMVEYYGLAAGTVTAFARGLDTLAEDLAAARPQLVPAVPRIFEKVYARIQASRDASGVLGRALFDWAVGVGYARSRCERANDPVPPFLRLQHALADRLVLMRIKAVLGGRVRYLLSGGAPLAPELAAFFHAVGLQVLEGYGLTETTPALTVNRPDRYKLGTVGVPLDCCEVQIAGDGEILARGANVALGYHRRPEATAEAWDTTGWFHTGDIGEFDAEGFLRITDRKKDLLKTSGGKYVAPQRIENLLKMQPHVSQAVVIGDNRKYCVALLTLDMEELARWAGAQRITLPDTGAAAGHAAVRELLAREVAAVNRELASYESIKDFRILPRDLTVEAGELTPSLKVKRKVVTARYRREIDEMYTSA